MAEGGDNQENLLLSLNEISEAERHIIASATKNATDNVDTFVSSKIGQLFKLVSVYKNAFERNSVETKSEFEAKVKGNFRNNGVREAFEEMLDAEQAWDEFLRGVDAQMDSQGPATLTLGQKAPMDLSLRDACSGQMVTLADYTGDQQYLVLVLLRHFA